MMMKKRLAHEQHGSQKNQKGGPGAPITHMVADAESGGYSEIGSQQLCQVRDAALVRCGLFVPSEDGFEVPETGTKSARAKECPEKLQAPRERLEIEQNHCRPKYDCRQD